MELLLFLWPSSLIGKLIVIGLISFFVWWCRYLYYWSITLRDQYIPEADALSDISELAHVIHLKTVEKDQVTQDTSVDDLKRKVQATFEAFCATPRSNGKPIDPSSPLAEHVKLLYQAGMVESRIDVPEIVKLTTGKIFHKNYVIKNVLPTFIVIGLLGTLLGLADSLNNLPISLKMSETVNLAKGRDLAPSNVILKQAIDKLFEHLHSAFAPSIWGTAFTVIGIGFYTYITHTICQPLKSKLENYTSAIWVPQLIPTTSQKALESLHLVELNLGKNMEAAQKVADFAKSIEQEVDGFGNTLHKANQTLQTISEYGDKMHMVATTFGESIHQVSHYQKDIQELYQKFVQSTDLYQSTLTESKYQIASLVEFSKQTFVQHGQHIEQMLAVLQQYGTDYMQDRKETSALALHMLKETKHNVELLELRNQEIIEAVGRPIAQNIAEGFRQIDDNSNLHLSAMVSKLEKIDAPLADTARLMSDTLEAVVKRMDSTLQAIMREATRQNEASLDHMQHINEWSKQIHELLGKVAEPKQKEEYYTASVERNMHSLAESATPFHTNTQESATFGLSWMAEGKGPRLKMVAMGIAAVFIILMVGSFGYSQYKVITTLQEVQKVNSQMVSDMKR